MASVSSPPHIPVLYRDVLSALHVTAGSRHIDGTLGAGGHAAGILEASAPDGELLGLDRDPGALAEAGRRLTRFAGRAHLRRGSFADLRHHAVAIGWGQVDGVVLDLGVSSMQVDDPGRGFSFRADGPLDMRFDPEQPTSADELINTWEEEALAEVIGRYGEEPLAGRVARAIVARRPIHSTLELANVIAAAVRTRRPGLHPATRTFQALRIAVNQELQALEQALPQAVDLLAPGGRLVVISFHSLEDRIVKGFIRRESLDCLCPPDLPVCTCGHVARLRPVSRRAVKPAAEEIANNPRSRSARLRSAERPGAA
ncbi:MAG: 16S rRNA (cytosine(1402)-N(4))-methyltransferase RsmH [Anaerolineales bacterium]|nr:16S rRNA (cytosine(1402)-N(4))-methyltransferase RsmH [Anaerolineales bacterium]